ncbi:MAG: Rrf2 family transcriptional regulator [Myxococcota bacterium]
MVTKTAIHAIKALSELAAQSNGEYLGASAIAERIGAPQNYLGKLLQLLSKEGLVTAQKGYNGGFKLARPPENISLFDIVEPIENVSRVQNCFLSGNGCSEDQPCALHFGWSKVRESLLQFLTGTTLKDVMKSGEGRLD